MGQISTRIDPREMLPPYGMQEERFDVPDTNVGKTQLSEEGYSKDIISRQAVMRAIDEALIGKGCSADGTMMARLINDYVIKKVPPAEPKRETATVSVGISKGGVTMWYECDACGEPVDQGDTFCSGCGRELIHE